MVAGKEKMREFDAINPNIFGISSAIQQFCFFFKNIFAWCAVFQKFVIRLFFNLKILLKLNCYNA